MLIENNLEQRGAVWHQSISYSHFTYYPKGPELKSGPLSDTSGPTVELRTLASHIDVYEYAPRKENT